MRINSGFVRRVAASALLAGLASCGGGGSSSDTELTATVSVPIATSAVVVAVEAGDTGTNPAVKIASPFEEVSVGMPLRVSREANGSTMVFASDASGAVLLMGNVGNGETLTVDSTARMLVSIALGLSDLADDAIVAQAKKLAPKAASFATLKANIASHLAAGSSPLSSSEVLTSVGMVVQESLVLAATAQGASIEGRPQAQSTSVRSVPFYLWDNSATDKIWITDNKAGSNSVIFNNRTFLQWAVTSTAGGPTVYVDPLKSTPAQLLAYYGGSESAAEIRGDKKFSFTSQQDSKTRNFNAIRAVSKVTFTIVDVLLALTNAPVSTVQSCVKTASGALINSTAFGNLVTGFSEATVQAFMKHALLSVPSIATKCEGKSVNSGTEGLTPGVAIAWGAALEKVLESLGKYGKPLALARAIAADYGTWSQLIQYNTFPGETYDVCRYGTTVRPCINRLTADDFSMALGASKVIPVQATDASGAVMAPLPSGLVYSTDNPSIFTVESAIDGTGASLKANSIGTAGLTVTDLVTGTASATVRVTVAPTETHWEVRYGITSYDISQKPPEARGRVVSLPTFAVGNLAGAYAGYAYFSDMENRLIVGADVGGGLDAVRSQFPVAWRSTSDSFEFDLPLTNTFTRRTYFTVTSRAADGLAGNVRVETTSCVYPDSSEYACVIFPSTGFGQWTARRVQGRITTDLKGFDFCERGNAGAMADPANWSWGTFVPNGCVFE